MACWGNAAASGPADSSNVMLTIRMTVPHSAQRTAAGGATDSVTSFIFREYRDRSNVGYGTLLAIVYLVLIVIAMTILMKLADRWMRPRY